MLQASALHTHTHTHTCSAQIYMTFCHCVVSSCFYDVNYVYECLNKNFYKAVMLVIVLVVHTHTHEYTHVYMYTYKHTCAEFEA